MFRTLELLLLTSSAPFCTYHQSPPTNPSRHPCTLCLVRMRFVVLFLSCNANAFFVQKEHCQTSPVMEAQSRSGFPHPKSQKSPVRALPTVLGSTPSHPCNQSRFIKDKLPDGIIVQPIATALSMKTSRRIPRQKPC
jgi:hypothetical protein